MAVQPGLSGTPYAALNFSSIKGRPLGLQNLSTNQTGGSRGGAVMLAGPAGFRQDATTADTTDVNLHPFGYSYLASGTSAVFTIDPPIPGLSKVIAGSTSGPFYVKTANGEKIIGSTIGSSTTTIKGSSVGCSFTLHGLTTGMWALEMNGSTGQFTLSTST